MENVKDQNPTQGFKIIIVVLAVVVAAVSILFYTNVSSLKSENELLNASKLTLQTNLTKITAELGNVKSENESIVASLQAERERAEALLTELTNERATSRKSINSYKRQVNNFRALIKKYVAQIEELNLANQQLTAENLQIKDDLKNTTLRAEAAEEDAKSLAELVKKGQVIAARDIQLLPLKKNGKLSKRMKRARKIKVDFALVANTIAMPGDRVIYTRLINPEGFVMSANTNEKFNFNGEELGYTASREVNYTNSDLKVSVYLDGVKGLAAGTYTVQIYMDGFLIGTKEIAYR